MSGQTVKIIGAGVAGLTAASELLEAGFNVTLYDKGAHIGNHACSWFAGGMLAPWCEFESADEPVLRLGREALEWWKKRVSGLEYKGSLVVVKPRDMADLKRFSNMTENFKWIEEDEVSCLEPDLSGRFRKALFFGDEAHLNPRDALLDLTNYIKNLGGKIIFEEDGYNAPEADFTVDATGMAACKVLTELRGVKGEMLIIKTNEVVLSRPVRLIHPRIPLYIVPRFDGHFMVGATMIESGERGRITARSMIELLSAAYALHPAFGEAEVIEIGTDVRPAFPDNLPRLTKKAGIYYLNGLYRHGYLLAPALAGMLKNVLLGADEAEFYVKEEGQVDDINHQWKSA